MRLRVALLGAILLGGLALPALPAHAAAGEVPYRCTAAGGMVPGFRTTDPAFLNMTGTCVKQGATYIATVQGTGYMWPQVNAALPPAAGCRASYSFSVTLSFSTPDGFAVQQETWSNTLVDGLPGLGLVPGTSLFTVAAAPAGLPTGVGVMNTTSSRPDTPCSSFLAKATWVTPII